MAGERHAARLYDRETMKPGCGVNGPAVIMEANATTVVEPGWAAEINQYDQMILNRVSAASAARPRSAPRSIR